MTTTKANVAAKTAASYATGCKGKAEAASRAAFAAGSKPPLSGNDSGKRWCAKVRSWSAAAATSAADANKALAAALAAIDRADLAVARRKAQDAGSFLASAGSQAGAALDWCTMMLRQGIVARSPYAKGQVTIARDASTAARKAAAAGRAKALEVIDELDQPPVAPPAELSTLDIAALAASVEEDAGQAIVFAVRRSGDPAAACHVTWNAGGTAAADDFVTGTELAGLLSWPAGDAIEQRLEFVLNPDRTLEQGENLVVTLDQAVDAKLGQARAVVGIVDDDRAPQAYDQDLPYGGTMLGAACQDGGPGNLVVRNQPGRGSNAIVFYLESDLPIVAIQTENRIDHFPLGSTAGGYSDHTVVDSHGTKRRAMKGDTTANCRVVQPPTGGDLRWRVAKVVSPETSTTLELEKDAEGHTRWAGQTPVITNSGRDASWNEQWHQSGGAGDAPRGFAASNPAGSYPTIWFEEPIDPKRLGWKVGDRLAYCISNSAVPDSGPRGPHDANLAPAFGKSQYGSVNQAYRARRPLRKTNYPYLGYCGLWWNSFGYDGRFVPMLLVGHRRPDGKLVVKGNGYCGHSGGIYFGFGGNVAIRQIVRIPADGGWAGRRLLGCDGGIWRRSSSTAGGVELSLRRAGKVPGDGADEGRLLGERGFAAADLLYGDLKNYAGTADPHRGLKLADPPEVAPGEAYYITLTPTGGSAANQFAVGRMLNYLGRGVKGLLKPDYQNEADRFQAKAAGGRWLTDGKYFNDTNYLHLGLTLNFGV